MPELVSVVDEHADISLHLGSTAATRDAEWYHHRTLPDGEVRLSLGKLEGGFLMQFKGFPSFYISEDGSRIECRSSACVIDAELRHLLLNQVLPHALGLRGYLTLHASVVGTDRGAIAFMGKSGQGKSTLVAAMLAAAGPSRGRRHARLVSDDCLIVRLEEGRLMTVSSYPCLRLRGESWKLLPGVHSEAGDCRVFGPDAGLPFERRPVPFHRLYLLAPLEAGEAASTPIPPRQAFVEAMENSFQLHTSESGGVGESFQRLADLVRGKVYRLHLPWDLGSLNRVAAALLDGRI